MNQNTDQEAKDSNEFYQKHFNKMIYVLTIAIGVIVALVFLLMFQIQNRPKPRFIAVDNKKQAMRLKNYDEPNLQPNTLTTWASRAAVVAYTYNFQFYNKQLASARPYFTEGGWTQYKNKIQPFIDSLISNRLVVNTVVNGPPVISNQGEHGGYDRVWRIQVPVLVTFQAQGSPIRPKSFLITLMVVNIPTTENPRAIAIDQFIMGSM